MQARQAPTLATFLMNTLRLRYPFMNSYQPTQWVLEQVSGCVFSDRSYTRSEIEKVKEIFLFLEKKEAAKGKGALSELINYDPHELACELYTKLHYECKKYSALTLLLASALVDYFSDSKWKQLVKDTGEMTKEYLLYLLTAYAKFPVETLAPKKMKELHKLLSEKVNELSDFNEDPNLTRHDYEMQDLSGNMDEEIRAMEERTSRLSVRR